MSPVAALSCPGKATGTRNVAGEDIACQFVSGVVRKEEKNYESKVSRG